MRLNRIARSCAIYNLKEELPEDLPRGRRVKQSAYLFPPAEDDFMGATWMGYTAMGAL